LAALNSQSRIREVTTTLSFHSCVENYKESSNKCNSKDSPVNFGYDVVAYWILEDGQPAVLGNQLITSEYQGYKFHFASEFNREIFESDPEKYLPAWGGYCAYGVSVEIAQQSELFSVKSDPNQWVILDDRLFLFRGEEAKHLFVADKDTLIPAGDSLWSRWFSGCFGFFFTKCPST